MSSVKMYRIHFDVSFEERLLHFEILHCPTQVTCDCLVLFQLREENLTNKSVICFIYDSYCSLCYLFTFAFTSRLQFIWHFQCSWFSHLRKYAARDPSWFHHWQPFNRLEERVYFTAAVVSSRMMKTKYPLHYMTFHSYIPP